MNFNNQRTQNVRKILDRIRNSGLNVTERISAIKIFIFEKLGCSMMNYVMSKVELRKLDEYIRKYINEMIFKPSLSKDMLYTSLKFGGLELKSLLETKMLVNSITKHTSF
jgi:hypothetical protein